MKIYTQSEFASKGGKARAEKLSAERRKEIASNAGKKSGEARKKLSTVIDLQAS